MANAIIKGYAKLIVEDAEYTIKLVPKRYKKQVIEELKNQGYDEQGNKIEQSDNGK